MMTNVRKMTLTTVALIACTALVVLITYWCRSLLRDFFYSMNSLLGTKARIGMFHSIILSFSFWCFLITPGIEAVLREMNWKNIYEVFIPQLVFSGSIIIWGIIATSTRVNTIWFWIFYHVGLIIGIRSSFVRITKVSGGGSSKLKLFIKDPLSKNDLHVSIIDRGVMCGSKVFLLVSIALLLFSLILLCIQYKQIFGI